MPTYTFTLPYAASAETITIADEVSGAVVDTIAPAATSGAVSSLVREGSEVVITANLDVGEYVATAVDTESWSSTRFSTEGVLDVPASLQVLPATFSPILFDVTLAADSPAIAINDIPAGYGELMIVAQVRATNASTNTQLRMCINNDVLQSNYISQRLRATSTTVDASNIAAAPYFQVADITGGTVADAATAGVVEIRLSNYDGTTYQQEFVSDYHYSFGTSASQYVGKYAGRYIGAAGAVKSVLLSAAAGNLKAGTRVTVYGRNLGEPILPAPSLFQLVFEGDSLTVSATGGGTNYPIHLSPKLSASIMANVATAGEATADVVSQAAAQVDAIFKTGIDNILLPWVGTNDLTLTSDTGDVIYGRYAAYCAARRTAGYKVVAFTLTPRTGLTGPQQTALTLFNTSVRANWATFADVLHDVAAISQFTDASNATYYADGLHLTDAGRELNATAIATLLHATFAVPLA